MKLIMKSNKMTYILPCTIIILVVILFLCSVNKKRTDFQDYYNDPITKVTFEESYFDVGNINNDTIMTCTYRFKNIGEAPLIIYYIDPGCICTGYSISDKMIMPGQIGTITLNLDAHKKPKGTFVINAFVRMNIQGNSYSLKIKGNVI